MKQLRIAENLSLPVDAVTQKLAFLGRTGSGKSYGATKLCELMLEAGMQIVALDPVGVWYGLRTAADGKGEGFPIPVFGGEHGDLPLLPEAGALIADLIVDRSISAVLDISMFESKAQHKRFAADFAERLFFRKKSSRTPLHLFLEESQEFVAQKPQKGEERMLGAFERLIKLGRNYGVGASLISQRPQSINKDALNQTECVFAFQMTAPHERRALKDWIAEQGLNDDIDRVLPKLQQGFAHVWSPVWLQISETVHVGKKRTFDASRTPVMGEKLLVPAQLSHIDVEEIRAAMADVVQRVEENDPTALKKQIAALKREMAKLQNAKPTGNTEFIEVPVFQPQDLARLENLKSYIDDLTSKLIYASEALDGVESVVSEALKRAKLQPSAAVSAPIQSRNQPLQVKPSRTEPVQSPFPSSSLVHVSTPQQKILNALAWFASVGIHAPSRSSVAAIAGVSPRSSGFEKNVSTLRSQLGLIEYPGGGCLALNDKGRANSLGPSRPGSMQDLHDAWLRSPALSNPQRALLQKVIEAHPLEITRKELADLAGVSVQSSGFEKNVSTLSGLGLVRYPRPGWVEATELLFPTQNGFES
jgi:hypothetical protein